MPLSVREIRELNKVNLYVSCCTDPASDAVDGAGVWGLSMYSSGGFPLHGGLDVGWGLWDSEHLGKNKLFSGLSGFVETVGNLGFGLVPQIDYVRKAKLKETKPLRFTVQCYLCLENGVEEDFLGPLSRLFF